MPSLASWAAAIALTGTALSTPVQKRSSFTVEQVQHPELVLRNGPAALAKAYAKFGQAVPKNLAAAAATRHRQGNSHDAAAQGTVAANPSDQYDASYLSPVTIGSTTVNLDFDTGSSDLWVFSSLQPQSQLAGHNYYKADPSKIKQGYSWNITYGDQSGALGKVYGDKVTVGGVTATSQAVEAASSVSAQFQQDQKTDGLLGLAFSTINTVKPRKQTTFFDTVKSTLSSQLFAVDLKYHSAGTYDFGFVDQNKYTGDLTYVDVDSSQGFWSFTADGYAIAGADATQQSLQGIFDTGTTLILITSDIASQYYAGVQGAQNSDQLGGWVFPCNTANLPDFTLTVSGVAQTVPGQYINFAPADQTGQQCFGGIQAAPSQIPFNIFGDIFLKSKYVVHDVSQGTPRIGLGQQS